LRRGWPVIVAAMLFYTAGMLLNDIVDRRFDATHRPDRPLPSGRVALPAAMLATAGLFAAGLALCGWVGAITLMWSVALVAAIVLYDTVHKRHRWSVIVMGLCRSLVYMTSATVAMAAGASPDAALWWRLVAPLAALLGLYVVLLTIAARRENRAVA